MAIVGGIAAPLSAVILHYGIPALAQTTQRREQEERLKNDQS